MTPPPPPPRWKRIAIVLNRESGTIVMMGVEVVEKELREIFEELGIEVEMHVVPGAEIQEVLEQTRDGDAEVVLIGGGDGTVASAATIFAHQDKPLGILPLGTFNLAARDVGMPLDLRKAAHALAEAPIGQMDLLDVAGKYYLCLVVLGFYPALAMGRPEYHGNWLVKAFKTGVEAVKSVATFPPLHLVFRQNGEEVHHRTRIALIANNDYEDFFGIIPRRESLDAGYFTLYVSKHRTRWGLFRSLLAWAIGRWKEDKEIVSLRATEIEITARRRRGIEVMRDGELDKLPVPFTVKLLPKALHVIAPRLEVERAEKEIAELENANPAS